MPLTSKPAQTRKETISDIVLGSERKEGNLLSLFSKLELSRRLGLFSSQDGLTHETMQWRFAESLSLMMALIDEIRNIVENNQGELSIVLLPGRSYVEQPASISAQYQEYFREYIRSSPEKKSTVKVIDLAMHLKSLHDKGINDLFFPNEGHLTVSGHRHVAQYLQAQISQPAVPEQSSP